jgi:DNA-binding NarL/FixJ family response regulator
MVEAAVEREDDMAVVGSTPSLHELWTLARSTQPDVVVVGLEDGDLPRDCLELLFERPQMKVLGIEARDGRAWLYELRPEQSEIGEVSPDDVVDTIRDAAGRPRHH